MGIKTLFGHVTKRGTPEWDEERRASEPTFTSVAETDEGWYAQGPDGWDVAFIPRGPQPPRPPDRCRHCQAVLSSNPQTRHAHIADCAVWS